ncbi:HNH endonuclease [Arcticibacter pallidicorallinus]|uniref:HNH endonuclease n=1 Tax=Arcticibacter pallidicorallinus TaxID=1259464 RepID=A0A2T0U0R8_9SPHI|nr:HNH endonuclease [Arcticibacter pallidicorallinus]PRY51511.1 HNH endonuclease [Arcticibacter pallidicorallinus]
MTRLPSKTCKYIEANYLKKSGKAIAKDCGCSSSAVQRYIRKKGFVVPPELRAKFRTQALIGKTTFTPEEDAIIREQYLLKPVKVLAEEINRSYTGIMSRLKAMGLSIPAELIQQRKQLSRIQKGSTPPNKGKKQTEYMSTEAIARTRSTRFKRGNVPHNSYNEPGKITIRRATEKKGGRAYQYICLELGKWKELHIHNWEKQNGPVPKGHCIWFKDGNSLNADVDNLELITRRENRMRNSSSEILSDKYVANCIAWRNSELKEEIISNHPELIELKREQIKLNRLLK